MLDKDKILNTLSQVNDPELHRSLTDLKMVRDVGIQDGKVEVTIALTVPNCPLKAQIESDVKAAIDALPEVKQVSVKLTSITYDDRKALNARPQFCCRAADSGHQFFVLFADGGSACCSRAFTVTMASTIPAAANVWPVTPLVAR